MRDIGFHFPDNSDDYKEIDSKILLSKVINLIRDKGFEIINIDSTICLEKPKINPYVPEMKMILCDCNKDIRKSVVNPGYYFRKMGFVGAEKGIVAHAVVLLSV